MDESLVRQNLDITKTELFQKLSGDCNTPKRRREYLSPVSGTKGVKREKLSCVEEGIGKINKCI